MRSKFKWIFTLLLAFMTQFSFAQEKTITGVVTDTQGNAVAGANIQIQGGMRKTQSDFDGKYTIKANTGDILVISFVGMQELRRTVGASQSISVKMQKGEVLQEVIIQSGIVGIKRTKDGVTYAQKTVGAREITQAVNPSAIFSLQGKVSGVNISNTSNGVNSTSRILIRGQRTISGNNDALVVIDNSISTANILSQIPPENIESMTIIKGAQGAAIYGAQGANGAVIVTTKKGSSTEKMTVTINSSADFENVLFVPQGQMDYGQGWAADPGFSGSNLPNPSTGFVPWENGSWGPAFVGGGMPAVVPVGLPQADGKFLLSEYAPIKDNMKQFFQTGLLLQNGVNVNIGGVDGYTNFSVNRQTTDFMVAGDELKRTSLLFKAGKRFGKFKIDGNVNYVSQITTQTDSDIFDDLIQTASNVPVSRFRNSANQHNWTVYAYNPWSRSTMERNDDNESLVNGSINLGYEFTKNISVNYIANMQFRTVDSQSHKDGFDNLNPLFNYDFTPYNYYGSNTENYGNLGGQPIVSEYYASQSARRNIYSDLVFNFNYDLTSDIKLKLNIGNNIQDRLSRITTQGGTNLGVVGFYNITNVLNPDQPATFRGGGSAGNNITKSRIIAGFANVDLSYKDFLTLNATVRFEDSSILPKSYQYPSAGISFVPTKAFEGLKDNSVLNYMKLNASYTRVGAVSAIGAYNLNELTRIPTGFPFGPLAALQYNRNPVDPAIAPEFINTLEFGGTLGFFNDRIVVEASYFDTKTDNLITSVTASSSSGNASTLKNVGSLSNKGFEIDLALIPVKTDSFKWEIRGNYSTVKTKILSLTDDINSVNLQANGAIGIFAEVGEEFPLIKGTAFARDANGNILVGNNGAPQTTAAFQKLGKSVPDYIIGLTNSFEYKGLRLTAVADLRMGASAYSFTKNLMFFTGGDMDTSGFDRTKGYIVPGVNATTGLPNTIPFGGAPGGANATGVLNYFTTTHRAIGETSIVDASALTIREISLSYGLPKKLIENTGIQSFRIGVNARNPFIFLADGSLLKPKNGAANNGYFNPEASNTAQAAGANATFAGTGNAQGIVGTNQYPTSRTVGFSLNLTF